MGIKDLAHLIGDNAGTAMRSAEMKSYFGRKIAIDASMSLYQFLIAVRQDGAQLTDENGETTSHLNGMFYRTIRMMENGVKPVYVFDGKPPDLKSGELEKRTERRAEASEQLNAAKERGDVIAVEKFERRLVRVTKEHNEEVKKLLRLMGIPVIDAPCEAEAQCAELVKKDRVYATATEDMDALTFGSKILCRHMTFSEAKKIPIQEICLEKVIKNLELSTEEFVDLCILLGCDYCPTIRGIGRKKGLELIQKYRTIENILENIDQTKYQPPENWVFKEARNLFLNPEVINGDSIELEWKEPDMEAVVDFLCKEKGFREDRIRVAIERLQKSRQKSTQGRIDCFFKTVETVTSEPSAKKRKAEEEKKKHLEKASKKAKKAGGGTYKRGK